jgi:hypothetical protein
MWGNVRSLYPNEYVQLPMTAVEAIAIHVVIFKCKIWLVKVRRLSIIRKKTVKGEKKIRITKMRKEKEAKVRRVRREG